MMVALLPIDTRLWKSSSQKLRGLGEPKVDIKPTSAPPMINVGLKSHTLQFDCNTSLFTIIQNAQGSSKPVSECHSGIQLDLLNPLLW